MGRKCCVTECMSNYDPTDKINYLLPGYLRIKMTENVG